MNDIKDHHKYTSSSKWTKFWKILNDLAAYLLFQINVNISLSIPINMTDLKPWSIINDCDTFVSFNDDKQCHINPKTLNDNNTMNTNISVFSYITIDDTILQFFAILNKFKPHNFVMKNIARVVVRKLLFEFVIFLGTVLNNKMHESYRYVFLYELSIFRKTIIIRYALVNITNGN